MRLRRLIQHLASSTARQREAFPPDVMDAITIEIQRTEKHHHAEIRFVVEAALEPLALLREQSPRERALEVFSLLRVWDTEDNDGVLIYVLLADRAVEIVADRGIHARAPANAWSRICRRLEAAYACGDFERGSLAAVLAVSRVIGPRLPSDKTRSNELPDAPLML